MKPEAQKTAPLSRRPTAIFNRGLRGFLGYGIGKAIASSSLLRQSGYGCWIRAIRVIRGSILPFGFCRTFLSLVAVVFSLQFSSSAYAQRAPTLLGVVAQSSIPTTSGGHANATGVDGLDCITADYPPLPWTGSAVASAEEEALQVTENSSHSPYDPEGGASVSADKASLPTRTNKKPPQLAETRFDAVLLHDLGPVPIFLVPTHSFYCLHDHIRERAPPVLG